MQGFFLLVGRNQFARNSVLACSGNHHWPFITQDLDLRNVLGQKVCKLFYASGLVSSKETIFEPEEEWHEFSHGHFHEDSSWNKWFPYQRMGVAWLPFCCLLALPPFKVWAEGGDWSSLIGCRIVVGTELSQATEGNVTHPSVTSGSLTHPPSFRMQSYQALE